MNSLTKMFLAGMIGVSLLGSVVSLAQSSKLDTQSADVVKLRIRRINNTEATAAGLYVGKDQHNAYFITACHAVVAECSDDTPGKGMAVESVRLQFHASPQAFSASVFAHFDPALDLAVVQTAIGNLPSQLPLMESRDAVEGIPVRIIGHPAAGEWSVSSGTVLNLNTASGDIHHFTAAVDASVTEGDSGGPVLDFGGGFLGMHTAKGPTYAIEAKSADILAQLKAWNVPRENLIRPEPVEEDVCLSGTFKEGGPDSTLTWSLSFSGDHLTGVRADALCSIDLSLSSGTMDDGPAWDGKLTCKNGHSQPNLTLAADRDCQNLKSNISWFKLGPRIEMAPDVTGEWAPGNDPGRARWHLTQMGTTVTSQGESGPANGNLKGKNKLSLRWNDSMDFEATVIQNHLDWNHGAYWVRFGTSIEPTHSNVSGRWVPGSDPGNVRWTLRQDADGSVGSEGSAGHGTGRILGPGKLSMSWNAAKPLTGVIQRDRIYWDNGTYWIRQSR